METNSSHFIVECLRPSCRFRYPAAAEPDQRFCPKCGSPVRIQSYPAPASENHADSLPAGEIEVLLDNIRSAYNVGSVLRTSDAVKISRLFCCGTTPTPDNPKVRKTALGAEFSTPWSMEWNALDTVSQRKSNGYQIVSLELASDAISLYDLKPEQVHFPLLLVLGSEVTGVDPEILDRSDLVIQIPMWGVKGSINVATAFGVAVYFLRYLQTPQEGIL